MMSKTPVLNFKDNKPYVDGNYEFTISDGAIYDNQVAYKHISFKWSVEMGQNMKFLQRENELYEMLAEKLKQDFLKYISEAPKL